jgi:hypothetical protein
MGEQAPPRPSLLGSIELSVLLWEASLRLNPATRKGRQNL